MFKEYTQYDATGLAALIAQREVSQQEVLEAALARAQAVEPQLHAICIPMYEQANQRVRQTLHGPFAGVPMLIKDASQDYAGVPATQGSRALRNWVPSQHAEVVARWLAAGMVIFGKTATPELCLKAVTESELWARKQLH